MLDELRPLLEEADTFAVIEQLHSSGDTSTISGRYIELANELYWSAKDLPACIAISRAGIQHNLVSSLPPCPADMSYKLRSNAKAMAYNLGSFTWDGWDEPGIAITASDLAVGRDAAALNLRLAMELSKPPKAQANAHWLLGAHLVSIRQWDAAIMHFAQSAEISDDPLTPVLNRGYIAIAHLLAGREVEDQSKAFDAAVQELRKVGTEDGTLLAEQLASVKKHFEPPPPPEPWPQTPALKGQ